jgi:Ulp1 family protease
MHVGGIQCLKYVRSINFALGDGTMHWVTMVYEHKTKQLFRLDNMNQPIDLRASEFHDYLSWMVSPDGLSQETIKMTATKTKQQGDGHMCGVCVCRTMNEIAWQLFVRG